MRVSLSWLQTYFDETLPSAHELADLLTFHSFEIEGVQQVEDDWVIDVDVLPNRSADCLSHRGIARELSVLLARPLKRDPLRDVIPAFPSTEHFHVAVDDDKLCPRYMGAVVRGVTVGPSPLWLRKRLETLGHRSINNVVDATNYIMLETGQPLHAFDRAKLATDEDGSQGIRIRLAEEGEQITVLTGETYTLAAHHMVIADGVSGAALALAGIKGGKEAEIDEGTTDIVLEAAHFFYRSVRKASRELRLATEASLRFQNEPARELPAFAMRDLITLVADIARGELVGVEDCYVARGEREPIDVTLTEINTMLGSQLTYDDVERILIRFEWEFSRAHDEFAVTPSWERKDLSSKVDVIEEVGRVYGYVNLSSKLPEIPKETPAINVREYYIMRMREALAESGYSEIYTYTLTDHGEVELLNPLTSDKSCMRMDLREGMLTALANNAHHAQYLGLATIKLFEVGTVFRTHGEVTHVAVGVHAVSGKQGKAEQMLLDDLATLADSFGMRLTNERLQDGVLEFSLDALLPALPKPGGYESDEAWDPSKRYAPWSPYPCVYRDIAVWVPNTVPSEEVLAVIVETSPETLVKHYQFDTFEKEGRISYAWHLVFQSKEKTLTDTEIAEVLKRITTAFEGLGWCVR